MAADLALNLPRDLSSPSVARRAAERQLAGVLSREQLGALCLLISELVSNAVVHGRGEVVLRLELDAGVVRGAVIDQGGGFTREIPRPEPADVGGRGLMLVESLASRWGVREGTTHVWFELSAG